MLTAITRAVSPTLEACELTWARRQTIDLQKAIEEHRNYERCLAEMGARVISLPALPDFPDAVFVEDALLVFDEVAIMTRMGAKSRRGEGDSLAQTISPFRDVRWLREPATLDGGDVMRIGYDIFVGLSSRTNETGIAQLADELAPFGYRVRPVEVRGCLHLKSACCPIDNGTIIANREWLDPSAFRDFRIIEVNASEPAAANVLRMGDTVLMPLAFPRTRRILEGEGLHVLTLDLTELMKAEAAVTCSSVVFPADPF